VWTYPLTQVMTTGTWLWELSGPILVVAVLLRERPSGGRIKRAFDPLNILNPGKIVRV